MRSEEAQIGKQVRVGEGSGLPPELQGRAGMVSGKWGNPWDTPEGLVLEVRLENGRTRLFQNHELEEIAEGAQFQRTDAHRTKRWERPLREEKSVQNDQSVSEMAQYRMF